MNVPLGFPATKVGPPLHLNTAVDLINLVVKIIDNILNFLSSNGAAYNEVAALQAVRTKLVAIKAALQAVHNSLATKEAVNLKGAAEAAPAGYSTAPTTVNSPLGLKLVSYPNGATIPTEGADILAVRASLQAAHDATISSASTVDH